MDLKKILPYATLIVIVALLLLIQRCSTNKIKDHEKIIALLSIENKALKEKNDKLNQSIIDIRNQGPVEVEIPVIQYKDRKVVEVRNNTLALETLERQIEGMRNSLDTCGSFWKEAFYITKKKYEAALRDTIYEDNIEKEFAGYKFNYKVLSTGLHGISFEATPKLIPADFSCPECPEPPPTPKNRKIGVFYGALYQEEMSHLFEVDYSTGPITFGVGHTRPMDKSGSNGFIARAGIRF